MIFKCYCQKFFPGRETEHEAVFSLNFEIILIFPTIEVLALSREANQEATRVQRLFIIDIKFRFSCRKSNLYGTNQIWTETL